MGVAVHSLLGCLGCAYPRLGVCRMNPVAETYARIMERRKGGKRLPIEGNERQVAPTGTGEAVRLITSPEDLHTVSDRPLTTARSAA